MTTEQPFTLTVKNVHVTTEKGVLRTFSASEGCMIDVHSDPNATIVTREFEDGTVRKSLIPFQKVESVEVEYLLTPNEPLPAPTLPAPTREGFEL